MIEYYCNTGDPFMGASVHGAGDEVFFEEYIEDEESFEEQTMEGDVVEEETEDDEFLEESGIERLFEEIGGKEALDDENEGEDVVEDETPNLQTPQSLWPLSPTFWNGLVPGWEQVLLPHSPPQVDHNDYIGYLNEPPTIDLQTSVAAVQHAHSGIARSSLLESRKPYSQHPTTASQRKTAEYFPSSSTYAHYSIAYDGHAPFMPGYPGLTIRYSKAANPTSLAGKAPSSRKPATQDSPPRASNAQGSGQNGAVVGKAKLPRQPSTKKDSRAWEEHEKARVKTLMLEVISEGTHASTEERWKVISRRLSRRYSIDRTWTAVKK